MNNSNKRSFEEIREHYEIEKELAARLKNATKEERIHLYNSLYDEIYTRVKNHPTKNKSDNYTKRRLHVKIALIKRYLKPHHTFLEIGVGTGKVTENISEYVGKVYAIDVTTKLLDQKQLPENVQFVLSNGIDINVPQGSINVAYSNQVMEHLHPDDAYDQLKNIYKALCTGGMYICLTPNGINGPHDISRYFDEIATGFHLKEYTCSELGEIFKECGFRKVKIIAGAYGRYVHVPLSVLKFVETILLKLPHRIRKVIGSTALLRMILGIRIIGVK